MQFVHRLNAYLVLIYATTFAVIVVRRANDDELKGLATFMAVGVWCQVGLGIATLITVVNIYLALAHQLLAVCLVITATVLLWRIARADRVFRSKGF